MVMIGWTVGCLGCLGLMGSVLTDVTTWTNASIFYVAQ